jgi:hypothetical protein
MADDLDAVVLHPDYPASELYRVVRDRDGLQFDFMAKVDGIASFESLRSPALARFGRHELKVASLEDVIRSKRSANRAQDRAVLPILRKTLREKGCLLALPMEKRTGFLRKRRGSGSHV